MSTPVVEHFDGVPVVRLSTDVDASNAHLVRERLEACMSGGPPALILDMAAVRYLDSVGIDMLFRLAEQLSRRRASLHVVIAQDSQLARLAKLVALASAMPVHGSVADAVASAAPSGRP